MLMSQAADGHVVGGDVIHLGRPIDCAHEPNHRYALTGQLFKISRAQVGGPKDDRAVHCSFGNYLTDLLWVRHLIDHEPHAALGGGGGNSSEN